MKEKQERPILSQIIEILAPRLGAELIIEPEWGIVGQVTFKNSRRTYFKYSTLDINGQAASDVARDKDYANFFMEKLGYPVVPNSKTFFSDSWAAAIGEAERTIDYAYAYAESLGFPVVIKPNQGAQGSGVYFVYDKQDFYDALSTVFKNDRVAIVQKVVPGKDYRLVVLDDELVSAYERTPLCVIGDGVSTIEQLLHAKAHDFIPASRDVRINPDDSRIALKLKHQGLSLESVPLPEQVIYLLDNANLSSGGDAIDVSDKVHPEFKKIAIALTKDMGLRLAGVDLMVEGDIPEAPTTYWVLEINASPGLNHYAHLGTAQRGIVEELYFKILQRLEHEGR